jgi:hypothetical protein
MHCPECGSRKFTCRGGGLLSKMVREFAAPQKYKCTRCSCRWLYWPFLYRGRWVWPRVLRGARRLFGGSKEWTLPKRV